MKTLLAALTLALSTQAVAQVYYPQYVAPGGNSYAQRLSAETYRYEQSVTAQKDEMIQRSKETARYKKLREQMHSQDLRLQLLENRGY